MPVSLTVRGGAQDNKSTVPEVNTKKEGVPAGFEKTNCYGSFLFETNQGELIFCEKQGVGATNSSLSFFFHTVKDQADFFEPIEQLYVSSSYDNLGVDKWWDVNFLSRGEDIYRNKKKQIKVEKTGQKDLNFIGSQDLQKICRKEIRNANEDILRCVVPSYNSRTETYIIPVQKGIFAF